MGIVNVTPDSFSDGGDHFGTEKAIQHGRQLLSEGADIVDIGGESTKPGAEPVSREEELSRVIPVIEGLRQETDAPISIDTQHTEVMVAAVEAGATIINDVNALRAEGAVAAAADAHVPVCVMHMQGEPGTMQADPQYENVVEEVYAFLQERVAVAEAAGIPKADIYVDVGIGFGKTLEHNLELLRNLKRFKELGTKSLLGTSRKSFIQKIMGHDIDAKDRLPGSLASVAIGLQAEVDVFRVHDVAATKQCIEVYTAITT